ncbi:MAG: YbaK/EbsC family protein [Rhodoferax sp.]|nr:YbaK/EbsC family protein [Rhodoferax sp.]
MSLLSVRAFFAQHQIDLPLLETQALTPTVESAAQAHGVEPGRIAKTLAFRLGDGRVVLLVASGHARIDNAKFKATFGKGKMLPAQEVETLTGHPVGGVCPFGLAHPLPVFLDQSLQAFDEVLPAAGSVNSAVRISPALMARLTAGVWVDACKLP